MKVKTVRLALCVSVISVVALVSPMSYTFAALPGPVVIINFQAGEVFDGRAGARDGVGDELFPGISSYFNTDDQVVTGFSGQAMTYFDISAIDQLLIGTATFAWNVDFAFGNGAPDITSIFGLANDPGLSLDDFNKGSLLGDVATTGFNSGAIVSIDASNFLKSFAGDFVGFSLRSNNRDADDRFLNMTEIRGARLDITFVPEPTSLLLLALGLPAIGIVLRRAAHTEGRVPRAGTELVVSVLESTVTCWTLELDRVRCSRSSIPLCRHV